MTTATPHPDVWTPPQPRDLPEWRQRIAEFHGTNYGLMGLAHSINEGKTSILPRQPALESEHTPGSIAAPLLAAAEQDRLHNARLFYASADMTALAVAAAEHPPREPFTRERIPAETGFMVFEHPIGGYTQRVQDAVSDYTISDPTLEVTTPIVAASWGRFTPHSLRVSGGTPVQWWSNSMMGLNRLWDDFDGLWITFYAPQISLFADLNSAEPIGKGSDGHVITAGEVAHTHVPGTPPVQWDNESLIEWGMDLSEPPHPDSTTRWVHVLFTAFQLMSQTSGNNALTDTVDIGRDRAGRRRDHRNGVTVDNTVRLIHVHTTHRPSPSSVDDDAQQSTGRREPHWTCRWPVAPHRRNTCQNPHGHADGNCTHVDRIIPPHIKGPADKPLKTSDTVHLWDRQPGGDQQ